MAEGRARPCLAETSPGSQQPDPHTTVGRLQPAGPERLSRVQVEGAVICLSSSAQGQRHIPARRPLRGRRKGGARLEAPGPHRQEGGWRPGQGIAQRDLTHPKPTPEPGPQIHTCNPVTVIGPGWREVAGAGGHPPSCRQEGPAQRPAQGQVCTTEAQLLKTHSPPRAQVSTPHSHPGPQPQPSDRRVTVRPARPQAQSCQHGPHSPVPEPSWGPPRVPLKPLAILSLLGLLDTEPGSREGTSALPRHQHSNGAGDPGRGHSACCPGPWPTR